MSDTNRARMSYAVEVTPGTDPGTAAVDFRYTGENIRNVTNTLTSEEIRSDRLTADIVRADLRAEGPVNIELSPLGTGDGFPDDLFRGALGDSTWAAAITLTASDISAAAADNSINSAAAAFTVTAGRWIKISGFATAGNNQYAKVLTATTSKLTLATRTALVNEAAGASVTVLAGGEITTSTELMTFSIFKEYTDVSNTWEIGTMMVIAGLSLRVTTSTIITGVIDWLGSRLTEATSRAGGYAAAQTGEVLEAIDHVWSIMENASIGSTPGAFALSGVTEFGFDLRTNARARTAIGTLGAISMGLGSFEITGTVRVYHTDNTLIAKYNNYTATSFAWIVQESDGTPAYVFDFPQVRLTSGGRNITAKNQDVFTELGWAAYRDPTEGIMMRITRFPG
jgi:hypothetical protein